MAAPVYSFAQFSADLGLFGFASADDLTLDKLTGRFKSRVRKVHPDRPGGQTGATTELNTARDRLRDWHKAGRPRFADEVRPQPGFADTAAAAQARAEARAAQAREEASARAKRQDEEAAELAAARIRLERLFRWRRWRRRALVPVRMLGWLFVGIPTDLMPWVVGLLLFVFGWPFLQDSSYGRYVPRFPSVYQWFAGTEFWRALKGGGQWVNSVPGIGQASRRNRRCSQITGECWYTD